jgi:hypothetical protein
VKIGKTGDILSPDRYKMEMTLEEGKGGGVRRRS